MMIIKEEGVFLSKTIVMTDPNSSKDVGNLALLVPSKRTPLRSSLTWIAPAISKPARGDPKTRRRLMTLTSSKLKKHRLRLKQMNTNND